MKYVDVPILMYHELSDIDNPWCVSPPQFKQHMLFLKENGYRAITLEELKQGIEQNKECPGKAVVITFDDARKGVYVHAHPLLRQLGFTATIYVVPQWIDGQAIPVEESYSEFLSWEELKELSTSGWVIGSHTFSHRNLARLSEQELQQELDSAEKRIQEELGLQIRHLSYPFGENNVGVLRKIQQRYDTAVTVVKGFDKSSGRYARQWILNDTSLEMFAKLLSRPRLSLCMIVKNEEEFLPHALASVQGLFDELIIVDTGSTDGTKAIASNYGAVLIDFPWTGDFSAARNISLQHATGDWILILDADEVISIEDQAVIREVINNWQVMGFRMLTKNYSNDSSVSGWVPVASERVTPHPAAFQGWYSSLKVRLFQRHSGILFQGAIHEMVDEAIRTQGGKVASLPVPIHHYGALKKDQKSKLEFYSSLTEKKIADDPHNAKAYFELGVQHKALGRFAQAEEAFKQSIQLDQHRIEPLLNLGIVLQKQSKFEEAMIQFQKVLELDAANAEALFGLGYGYFCKNELEQSVNYFRAALRSNPSFIDAYVNLGAIYEKSQKFTEALEVLAKAVALAPSHGRAYYNIGVVCEKQGNAQKAIAAYERAIQLGYTSKDRAQERVKKLKELVSGG